ncbi:MAG: ParB N-terminal domain-containing protein [Methyloprofundus sp.]|nr:ParB N-terminal domain-containing protein [Methyloprofundus sp.]
MGIQIEYILVDELIDYEKNTRTHSDEQIQQIAASISEFGFTNPVLIDEENILIAGHGRTLAAKSLDMEKVPAIRLTGLDDSKKKALRISDNSIALNSGWDMDLLAEELADLKDLEFDLDVLGFDDDFLDELLMDDAPDFDPENENDQGKLDQIEPKWICCPNCGKEFDMNANKG